MTEQPKSNEQTPREIMDKILAMTPEEISRMLADNFKRMCSQPLTVTNGER